MGKQFEFREPKVKLNRNYEEAIKEIRSLPHYGERYIQDSYYSADIRYEESDGKYYISHWNLSLLNDEAQEILRGVKIISREEQNAREKEVREIFKKHKVKNYADAYCPYTGALLEIGFPVNLFPYFDNKHHTISTVPDEDLYVRKSSISISSTADFEMKVPTLGAIRSRFSKLDISDAYSELMVSIMRSEWEREVLVPSKVNLELIKDEIDEVTVYYESISKEQSKRLYNAWDKGRFYSYKGKRIYVDTPDIENLGEKLEEAMEIGSVAFLNKYKGGNVDKSDVFIHKVSEILLKSTSNNEKMKEIKSLF